MYRAASLESISHLLKEQRSIASVVIISLILLALTRRDTNDDKLLSMCDTIDSTLSYKVNWAKKHSFYSLLNFVVIIDYVFKFEFFKFMIIDIKNAENLSNSYWSNYIK